MVTIKTGHHYPTWPFSVPWIGTPSMTRYVRFSENCKYDSAPYNDQDVNKLFGLSFGLGGVHHNSARFGWRWSNADQCIELLAYVYNNGVRNWDEQLRFPVIAQVALGEAVCCYLDWERGTYEFDVKSVVSLGRHDVWVTKAPDLVPHYGLTHGLYFGGELTAPHDIDVTISRTLL